MPTSQTDHRNRSRPLILALVFLLGLFGCRGYVDERDDRRTVWDPNGGGDIQRGGGGARQWVAAADRDPNVALDWSVSAAPTGMSMNTTSGALFGTPTVAGAFNVVVTVRDSGSPQQSASRTLLLTVVPAPAATLDQTSIPSHLAAPIATGRHVTQEALMATGGSSPFYSWSVDLYWNGSKDAGRRKELRVPGAAPPGAAPG